MASTGTDLTQSTMEPVIVQEIDQVSSETNILTKHILQDPYDEEESEQKFLLSKPTCFIIIGKPGSGKTTLAQKFAQYWKCEFMNAHMLLSEILKSPDDRANTLWQILYKGERIPEEIVFQILEQKINSPEVGHHGYILDDYPTVCEDFMNIQDQFERMKTWKLTPDFIINLRIPDEDLLARRISQRTDPQTGTIYTEEVYNYVKQAKKEFKSAEETTEEDVEDEEEEIEEAEELDPEIIKNLLIRPEDLTEQADGSIQKYKSNMLRIMEEYMIDYDRDYVIELDANQPAEVLVQQIITKLQLSGLSPAAVLQRLYDDDEGAEEAAEELDTNDSLKVYSTKKTVAAQYPWKKSRWGRNCPVALYEGNMIPGKNEYSVSFLDKMYFLSSVEFMDKFLRNPRPYLLRPHPKPPCKISVLGMPKSGKTSLCYLLANKYQAKVIQIQGKMDEVKEKLKEEKLKTWTGECTEVAIETVKKNVRKRMIQEFTKTKKRDNIKLTSIPEVEKEPELERDAEEKPPEVEDVEKNLETDEQDQNATEDTEKKESVQASEPVPEDAAKVQEDELKEVEEEEESLDEPKLPQPAQPEVIVESIERKSSQEEFEILDESELNPKLQAKIDEAFATIDANHPEVCEVVDKLMKDRGEPNIILSADNQFDILVESVSKKEEDSRQREHSHIKSGGWILDDSPSNSELWQVCVEKNWLPDTLICLIDGSKGYNWLLQQWFQYQSNLEDTNVETEKINPETTEKINPETTETEPKEVNADKSVTDIVEDVEGEEATAKVEGEEATAKVEGEEATAKVEGEEATAKVEGEEATAKVEGEEATAKVEGEEATAKVEGEEATAKVEEFEPTETESKLLVEEEASVEMLLNQEKDPTQTSSESPENEPTKSVDVAIKSKDLSKAAFIHKERLKKSVAVINSIVSTVSGITNLEPLTVEINDLKIEDIFEKVVAEVEKPFQDQAVEYGLVEMEEDDEQYEEEENDNEENEEVEEEEEEENIHHSRKRLLGNTSYYCPVMLKDKGILCPGKPESTSKYANKLYYMSSAEALEQFLVNSVMYISKDKPPKPPAIRLCIVGVHGSGKTVYGRYLARKLGIFHICFHEKLQEMILRKTGKKVGPYYDQASVSVSEESENEEEETDTEKMDTSDESTVFGELTEEEEIIKANLEGENPLPIELMEKILSPWWFQEPYRSTGFILEGFPRIPEETIVIQDYGLWLDAAIILNIEDTDVVGRLLPPKMEEWKINREKKKEHLEKKKVKAKKEKELRMIKRREELEKEQVEKKRAKQAKEKETLEAKEKETLEAKEKETLASKEKESVEEEQHDEFAEEEEEMDIEMQLMEEFQEEAEEEDMDEIDEESEEDAYDKFFGDITEQYELEATKVTNVQEGLEDAAIPRILVDTGRRQHIVNYVLNRSLKPYVEFRESIFERVYPVSETMARQLLNNGYKQPSCLGYWCPVNLQENVSIQTINSSKNDRYPCIYRQHIYFLSSTEAREKFIKNPLSFLKINTKPRPVVPLKLAIVGPPKSGKTYLCNKFSEKYGVERLSVGVVTRRILETQPKSHLSSKMLSYLCKGILLPDELAIEALEVVLLDMNCQTKGYVLDGFPFTKHQMELMTARKIIPVRVISLDIDSTEVVQRGAFDRLNSPRPYLKHDSGQVLAMRYQVFQREVKPVIEWYENKHQNLYQINGKQSKWAVWVQVKQIVLDSVWEIQNYLLNIKEAKAASLSGMCVTNEDFMARLGDFGQFCPVNLALQGELVDCCKDTTMDLVAEFRGYYYKMATKENLQLFMEEPEKFVPPNAPHALPPVELLPRHLVPQEQELQLELSGYCPVTFLDGKCRYEAITPGKPSFLVEYKNKVYSFASEEQLDKFMRLPKKYSDLELPHKLPPKIDPMDILQLPHLGYMEQTVATPLLRALVAVGDFKPKYPFLTATRSALVYVAYHLKAFNPRNSDYIRKKYQKKLKRFENDCELIGYLSHQMTDIYLNPVERSEAFNNKIDTFFALKGFEPSLTWIA